MDRVFKVSKRVEGFSESVIREMTRFAQVNNAINLAQGFPDFPAPDFIKKYAVDAINHNINQYAITWGSKNLRDAVSFKMKSNYALDYDPEKEITVTCGSTEGMIATLLGIINKGDEVIIFEPFYENYGPDTVLSEAKPRFVTLTPPFFELVEEDLKKAFNNKTKAIIINNPNNPSGKVFTKDELELIAKYCIKYNVIAVTDEIYEHIVYNGAKHITIASIDGMRDRTVIVNGASKTFSVTGWRVGYVLAPPILTLAIRKVHDFLTVGSPAPLQEATASAILNADDYYHKLGDIYQKKRDYLVNNLNEIGFECVVPQGAYYIMTGFNKFGFDNDVEFARYLVEKIGVAVVPGSSFYRAESKKSAGFVRFCFCKKEETLKNAVIRLKLLAK